MDFKFLGFTNSEGKVYKALIKLGKSSASKISRESEVPYGKIYEILASLERKGLVKIVPEKTKMFIPADPQNLVNLIEKRDSSLEELKKDVEKIKQVYDLYEEEIIEIAEGKKNFYKIVRQLKKPKKFNYTIKFTSEFNPEWERADKRLLREGVDVKSLVRYDAETEKNVKKWLKVHKNIKQIKNQGVAMDIRDNSVLISLIKKNRALLIKDYNFVEIMRTFFLDTYKNANKII